MNKKFIIIILLILTIAAGGFALFQTRAENSFVYNCFGGYMGFGMIGMVLFWIIVLMIALLLIPREKEAKIDEMRVLKNRLANGEISLEEYEIIKQRLQKE